MSAARKRAATPSRDGGQRSKRQLSDCPSDAVEVVCRLTPYNGPSPCLVPLDETTLKAIPPVTARKKDFDEKSFEFGHVFDDSDGQRVIFDRCAKDLIAGFVSGQNGLLFTYGVTGSGKTYTMTGKPTSAGTGILPRTLDVIFNSIENKVDKCVFAPDGRNGFSVRKPVEALQARNQMDGDRLQISTEVENRYMEHTSVSGYVDDYVCAVFVSYVEIYNNYCYDLLERDNLLARKDTRMDGNGQVYVEGAIEVEVEDSDEALEVFCRGEERRRTANTLLNKESSRSHSVFSIRLVMSPFKQGQDRVYPDDDARKIVISQLNLVDLAGSERAKRTFNGGDRLAEAGNINKSLMVLRQCFDKLRKNQRSRVKETVPYRESKLTHLFKNFLEGNGKIRMIICANPKPEDFDENMNVLGFADESQSVQVRRGVDRLTERDEDRPPVPRMFYQKWNCEADSMTSSFPEAMMASQTAPPNWVVRDASDIETIEDLKQFYSRRNDTYERDVEELKICMEEFEPALRSVLCASDYNRMELEKMAEEREKESKEMMELTAENKQHKREIRSLKQRLHEYEKENEELAEADERERRKRRAEARRIQQQEHIINTIEDICEGSPAPRSRGNVAQLTSQFDKQKRTLVTSSSTQLSSAGPSTGESRRQPRDQMNRAAVTPATGRAVFDPRYHRRSKSASRVLDHQPIHRVPTGSILKPHLPLSAKHVTRPEVYQLQKSSEYVLTHQEADEEGNVSTSMYKSSLTRSRGRAPLLDRTAPSYRSGAPSADHSLRHADTFSDEASTMEKNGTRDRLV